MKPLILLVSILFTVISLAKDISPKVLESKINRLIKKSQIKQNNLGIEIRKISATNKETLYALNSDKMFVPASLTKIPTAAAAFHFLGPNHRFITTLESDAKIKDGVLKGNLYFVGGGDPTFTSESMWSLVNEFSRENIHTIEKNIIVDDTLFDAIRYDKRRDPTRKDRAYDAPVGALSFNWNAVNVFIRPTSIGAPAQVIVDPTEKYFKVINKARTVYGKKQRLKVSRVQSKDSNEFPFETIIVSGSIGLNSKEYVSYKSITQPEIWSGYSLKKFLEEKGIKVLGKVIVGKKPAKTTLRADYKSEPLFESIKSMNKYSNNFVAEMLIKNIAAKFSQPASMDLGLNKVNEFLQKSGFQKDSYNYVNASGLTRDNKFKPNEFTDFLVQLQNQSEMFPEFLTSLPISAVDGTLKTRMTRLASAKKVRAKTGMLNDVIGLAGYVSNSSDTYAFTFIFNGKKRKLKNARDLFDFITAEMSK